MSVSYMKMLFSYIYKIFMLSTTCVPVKKEKKKRKEAILPVVVYFGFGGFCLSFIINASQMAMVLPEFIIGFFK